MNDRSTESMSPADLEMKRVLRTSPIEAVGIEDAFNTRLARWQHGPVHDVVKPMSDHVVMTYLGAMQRFERKSEREYVSGVARRGRVTFIPAGSSSRWDIYGPLDVVQLYLAQEMFEQLADQAGYPVLEPLVESTAQQDSATASLLFMAHRSLSEQGIAEKLFRQQLATLIGIQLIRNHSNTTIKFEKAIGGLSPSILRNSLERLSSEDDADHSLGSLANAANLSRFHFCRAFKKSTGLTPHEWLRQQKMEKAMAMLREQKMQITEIAEILGYGTLTAFGAAFKRHTGMAPGEWRRISS